MDVMVAVGMERCDKVGRMVIKDIVLGDGEEEVLLDVFFLWAPDLLTMLIDNGVLMGVVGDSSGVRQGGEEVGEEVGFGVERECKDRENGSGWGRGGNDSNGSFSNGQQEVLYWDVGK
jgi:hypothetical protein